MTPLSRGQEVAGSSPAVTPIAVDAEPGDFPVADPTIYGRGHNERPLNFVRRMFISRIASMRNDYGDAIQGAAV
ncbi:hypothetical protein BQ8482_130142 [Mesorhizobium delmotii]|uniref:Uncharacterized protein n=1 Tax=Mesorhizobium delmotii TaxID=1631247 RepID=A0A2P9AGH2_9HYPH|nr:hypothetical protein BQ8482_130142 [Mesorhizobium delmotii]